MDAQRGNPQSKGVDDPPNTCPLHSLLSKTLPVPAEESQVPRSAFFLLQAKHLWALNLAALRCAWPCSEPPACPVSSMRSHSRIQGPCVAPLIYG